MTSPRRKALPPTKQPGPQGARNENQWGAVSKLQYKTIDLPAGFKDPKRENYRGQNSSKKKGDVRGETTSTLSPFWLLKAMPKKKKKGEMEGKLS